MKKTLKRLCTGFLAFATVVFINRENTMAVRDIDKLNGHTGSAFHGIFVFTGGAETAVTAERNKFEFFTVRTAIHCSAQGRILTAGYLINIFHLSFLGCRVYFISL